MNENDKKLSLPPLRMSELQDLLRQSSEQHKKEVIYSYRDTKKKRQKEIADLDKYKTIERKGSISIKFSVQFPKQIVRETIWKEFGYLLCKEPLIDDFLKRHIIAPQRNLEKGLKDIKTGRNQFLDGKCFGEVPESKLSQKEKQFKEYWKEYNKQLSEQRYKMLLDSQTGLLKALKIFVPNKYSPGYFDDHPSQILSFTEMHKHSQPQIWSPNSFYGDSFEENLKQFQSKSNFKLSNTVLKDQSKSSIKVD